MESSGVRKSDTVVLRRSTTRYLHGVLVSTPRKSNWLGSMLSHITLTAVSVGTHTPQWRLQMVYGICVNPLRS